MPYNSDYCNHHLIDSFFQVFQTWSRVEKIAMLQENNIKVAPVPLSSIIFNEKENYIEDNDESKEMLNTEEMKPKICTRKFDFYEITKLTLGETAGKIMAGLIFFSWFPILMAYSSIFATSFASNVPIFACETCNLYDYEYNDFFNECKFKYWAYLGVFSAIMIFLSFFRIKDQREWQVLLCLFRIIALLLINITCLVAIFTDSELEGNGKTDADPKIISMIDIGYVIPIILIATFYQTSLPTTTEFVRKKAKNVPKLTYASAGTVFILFSITGIITNYGIHSVETLITMNWRDYSGGNDKLSRPWWACIIANIVILLPALNAASAFPIASVNLCDNFISIRYGYEDIEKVDKVIFI